MSPERKDLVRMLAIGFVAAGLGTWGALSIDWFPVQAAEEAEPIDTLYDWLLVASVPMFVLVMAIAIYCVVRFRARPGGPSGDGAPIHGNTRLEVIWVTIPFIMVTVLAIYAAVVLAQIEEKKPNTLVVRAVGQQFTWHFVYNENGQRFTSSALTVPLDRPVKVEVRTRDVLHSFWVPAFRLKIDAVPGITTHVRFTPSRLGEYEVVCAELCGLGHATMRNPANVVEPERFERFVQNHLQPPQEDGAGGEDGDVEPTAALGKQIFTGEGGCGACHTLADAGTTGAVGPALDDVASQGAENLHEDIVDPNAEIAEGFSAGIMPQDYEQRLSPEQIDALVKYLLEAGK